MMLDWLKAFDLVSGLVSSLIASLLAAVLWLIRQRREISTEISRSFSDGRAEFGKLHEQVQALERRVDHAATGADVRRIEAQLSQTNMTLARLDGLLGQQAERDRGLSEHLNRLYERVEMIGEAMLRRDK